LLSTLPLYVWSCLNVGLSSFAVSSVRRSQWPDGLRRESAATRLLGLWVRILPRAWMSVSYECCVSSGRGLCDGLITRVEESYRVWCTGVKPGQ